MTTTNREVLAVDPTVGDIPNLGVAKVKNPESAKDWATLEWELRSFVCEGEYARGLERILSQYLSHLGQNEQPAVWVSGFFGSGKSHLMRVLEYLWRDYTLPSGASARGLATLPAEITAHLAELSTAAKRSGGLWSAAGTLGSGASGSVRLAFLAVVLDAADLPTQYAPAMLALWLREQDLYDKVHAAILAAGKTFEGELENLYVSPVLAQALLDSGATFGDTAAAVSTALQSQFPNVEDISNDQMLDAFERVLRLQSDDPEKLPLVLIVLDELQQYVNDDNKTAEYVQHLVEGCSSRFGSRVLIVATGQAALTATPTMQKLTDRFSVGVALSDTDVETVVRQVVLRKKPDRVAEVQSVLADSSGEIHKHLGGSRLEAKAADETSLVPDYPLLPTRRRFWERALRAIDKAGKSGVLRTQLKIVHEAARSVADLPLGHVIGADFVFESESSSMLQSGVLLREIDELIRGLDDGTADGRLKSRACALTFLISQLPQDGVGDTGVRATAGVIADLLVEDLANDGPRLRKDVPRVLEELVELGRVMKLGDEYHLQTQEGAEWTKDFNQRRASIGSDASRMSLLRSEWLLQAVDEELAGIKLLQGVSKTPRKFEQSWGDEEPAVDGTSIPVWIRDEWSVTESSAREAAARAGTESPIVFVLLPKIEAQAVRDTLSNYAAAMDTKTQRPEPQTDEGRQAKRAMESRIAEGQQRLESLFGTVIARARVFQGGGNELTSSSLRDGVQSAGQNSLTRLFPKFGIADNPNWAKVGPKVRDCAPDALGLVGWAGDVPANPVCKELLARMSASGTKGSDLQKQLGDPPFGWPKDAIDGALLALLANGSLRVERDSVPVAGARELPATQVGRATFYKEDEPPSATERMAVRGALTEARVEYVNGQEQSSISGLLQHLLTLAARAGGPAPLPDPPDTAHILELSALAGNQQFRAIAASSETLRQDCKSWSALVGEREVREASWDKLDRLLRHAGTLEEAPAIRSQRDGILESRMLLSSPDPVTPLIEQLCAALRAAVLTAADDLGVAYSAELAALEGSVEWPQIEQDQQQQLLVQAGFSTAAAPAVATAAELLTSLDAVPLDSWQQRIQALPVKAAGARAAAAKILEPKSVTVKPAAATVKTEADVDAYLSALRTTLMGHVDAGETVII